jgi:hypothetical protein
MKLPEMSVIDTHIESNYKIRGYTAEQMLAWGKACAEAEREACAKLCDGWAHADGDQCAAAIRIRNQS